MHFDVIEWYMQGFEKKMKKNISVEIPLYRRWETESNLSNSEIILNDTEIISVSILRLYSLVSISSSYVVLLMCIVNTPNFDYGNLISNQMFVVAHTFPAYLLLMVTCGLRYRTHSLTHSCGAYFFLFCHRVCALSMNPKWGWPTTKWAPALFFSPFIFSSS